MLLLGVGLAVAAGLTARAGGLAAPACWTAAITVLCATWWVTEPLPIPVTSMIPFAAFPLTGVIDHQKVGTAYGHTLILLLLGGFMLSAAMERSGAHRRLAVAMVRLVGGGSPRRLVLGFMLATAALSMWISNTATTLMMLPVALAVIDESEGDTLEVPLLLGVAYSASIGGMGTPVGTPPNVIFMGVYREVTGQEIGFATWMSIALPAVVVLLPIAWWALTRKMRAGSVPKIAGLGPWKSKERRVLVVFVATAVLWVTRSEPWGGWSGLLGTGAGDSTVALAAVVVMFLVPDGEQGRLLDWPAAKKIPWGLLLLFGGGIAIARAFKESGLSDSVAGALSGVTALPVILMIAAICLSVTFLTEVTSNTATSTLLMPVLAAVALAAEVDPALLMVPAVLSASCAFMLPVATAPNAIIFGTERVPTRRMAREGVLINLMGAVAITLVAYLRLA